MEQMKFLAQKANARHQTPHAQPKPAPKVDYQKLQNYSGKKLHAYLKQLQGGSPLPPSKSSKSHVRSAKNATKIDMFSSEIDPALTDPIHAMPLIVYDRAFQPMGTNPNNPRKDRTTSHFQDPTATNGSLQKQGPKFPKQMTTIGNIISGCHDDINACVQHCRIAWSYKKMTKNLDG